MPKFFSIIVLLFSLMSFDKSFCQTPEKKLSQKEYSINDSIAKYKQLSVKSYGAGDLESFKYYTEQVLEIAEKNDLKEIRIRSFINLAIYYQQTDQYEEALTTYTIAENLTASLEDTSYVKILVKTNLGNLYNALGDYEKTKITMKNVLKLAVHHKDKVIIRLTAINTLGTTAIYEKKYQEALAYFDKLKLILLENNDNGDALSRVYINISDCYRSMENYEEAIKKGKEALDNIAKNKSLESEALAKYGVGVSYFKIKEFKKALSFLSSSNTIASEGGFLKVKMKSHEYLAKIYENLNDISEALKEQKKYSESKDAYHKTLSKAQLLSLKKESEEKSEEISSQQEKITFLSKEKIAYGIIGGVLLLVLGVFVIIYYQKKKEYVGDAIQLQGDKMFLENENEALRDKLNKLASVLQEKNKEKQKSKDKKTSLSIEDQKNYKEHILNYMEASSPYLNHEIKQLDVAKALDMSSHLLSETLNVCFEQNFNNFMNLYRVEKAKLLMKNVSYNNYKIITIAYESGFSSKSSFNRVFKNLVGCTPTEFQKSKLKEVGLN